MAMALALALALALSVLACLTDERANALWLG